MAVELAASGLTAVAFCLGKGLHTQRLSWWKTRLARRDKAPAVRHRADRIQRQRVTPRILPVVSREEVRSPREALASGPGVAASAGYEITLGGSIAVRVPHDFHDDSLARLLRVLQEAR